MHMPQHTSVLLPGLLRVPKYWPSTLRVPQESEVLRLQRSWFGDLGSPRLRQYLSLLPATLASSDKSNDGSPYGDGIAEENGSPIDLLHIGIKAGKRRLKNGDVLRYPKERILSRLSHLAPFEYLPLPKPSTNIRLITIHPGEPKDVLRCTLRVTDINESPEFTALSYSWKKDLAWKHRTDEINEFQKAITGPLLRYALKQPKKYVQMTQRMQQSFANLVSRDEEPGSSRTTHENIFFKRDRETSKSDEKRTIICNDEILEVHRSLYDALLQLRKYPTNEYWIDAICINQEDMVEKTAQVAMMGKIYRTAKVVLVWLGVCPTYVSPGITDLKSVAERMCHNDDIWEEMFDAPLGSQRNMNLLALIHLLSRRYFQRIWVLQEMALAQNLVFILGEHSIDPETIYKIANALDQQPLENPAMPNIGLLKGMLPRWTGQFITMPFPRGEKAGHLHEPGNWSLLEWLESCVGREAERTEDLVFAGLSLVHPKMLRINTEIQLPALRMAPGARLWPRLRADCTVSTREVMLNLAACILSDPGDLYLLSITSQYRRRTTSESSCGYDPGAAASWIPMLAPWCSQNARSLADSDTGFCAATKFKNDARISEDGRKLFLWGARFGTVLERLVPPGVIMSLGSDDLLHASHAWNLVDAINRMPYQYRDTDRSSLAALANVCTWGVTSRSPLDFQKMILGFCFQLAIQITATTANNCESIIGTTVFRHFFDSTYADLEKEVSQSLEMRKQYKQQSKDQKQRLEMGYDTLKNTYPEVPWPESGTKISEEDREALLFHNSFYYSSAVTTRRIFTTDSGYIGLAWAAVRPSDEIFVIKGTKVPYILRPLDDALRVEIETAQKDIAYVKRRSGKLPEHRTAILKLRDKIQDLESRLGKGNGWVLVGEAYVEGLMDGEAAERHADRFELLTIV